MKINKIALRLFALVLALNSSALATDASDLASALLYGSKVDDSGEICKSVKRSYVPSLVLCLRTDIPLFLVAKQVNAIVLLANRNITTTPILVKYSSGATEFTKEEGGFYSRDFNTDIRLNNPNSLRMFLDPVNKYITDIVIY